MMTTKMERIDFLYFALFWVGLFNAGKYEIFFVFFNAYYLFALRSQMLARWKERFKKVSRALSTSSAQLLITCMGR